MSPSEQLLLSGIVRVEAASGKLYRALRKPSKVGIIEDLALDTPAGHCPLCGEPMPLIHRKLIDKHHPPPRRVHCGSAECRVAYMKIYGDHRREMRRAFENDPVKP